MAKRWAEVAVVETDLSFICDANDAVRDLEALLLSLCRTKLSAAEAERMAEGLSRVGRGLLTALKWESWIRNGRHLREDDGG